LQPNASNIIFHRIRPLLDHWRTLASIVGYIELVHGLPTKELKLVGVFVAKQVNVPQWGF
jgi:hypothetical protein